MYVQKLEKQNQKKLKFSGSQKFKNKGDINEIERKKQFRETISLRARYQERKTDKPLSK